jgi:hypothetical protein
MDDATRSLAALAVRRGFTVAGTWLAAKGVFQGTGVDVTSFVGACMVLAEVAYEGWHRYGTVLVDAELARLKGVHPREVAEAAPPPQPGGPKVKAVIAFFAVMLAGLVLALPALAQNRLPLTGNIGADIHNAVAGGKPSAAATPPAQAVFAALAQPFNALANFIADDSDSAAALATAIPDLQDGHGQQCWMATKKFGEVIKAHPVPVTLKAQTDLEALRLLSMAANTLCANPHCTQVFADLATGVQTLAPLNASIPIPSLHDICAKIPQVAVIAPLPDAAAAPAAAGGTPAVPVTPASPPPPAAAKP